MYNKVILIGRLGQDPELKTTPTMKLCELRMVTEKGRGEDKRSEWHTVKVFGEQAEICYKYLKSGRTVLIEGEIQSRAVNDKLYKDIVASIVQFL